MCQLVLLLATVLLTIAGLLAMHTLSSSHDLAATGPGGSHPVAAHAQHHADPHHASAAGGVQCRPGHCDPHPPAHDLAMTTCVLALLLATLLLAPSALLCLRTLARRLRGWAYLLACAVPRPRPPSLLELSISRT